MRHRVCNATVQSLTNDEMGYMIGVDPVNGCDYNHWYGR